MKQERVWIAGYIFILTSRVEISISKPFGLHITFVYSIRTSSGTFLRRGHDQIVTNIEKRIADVTFIPVGTFFLPFVSLLFVISLFIKLRIDSPTNVFDSIMSYKSEMLSSL
jgi:hypothetical protein